MNSIEWNKWDEINKIESDIQAGASIAIDGLSDTQRHHMFYSLVSKAQKKAVYVSANDLQARKAHKNFQSLFGDGVIYFSPREKMLYDVEAKSHEQSYQRIECLNRLLSDDYTIAIFSCESLLDLYMPADEFRNGF
ncbi:MAG: transcription-repair coupling factor, partial [Ruminiclostridium sp.]|nr:transcription-repair coupling factor [Ruminiclostridium sp.]